MNRLSWDQYFMEICYLVSKRSTCIRRNIGAVLVKDKRILSTGYNGAPSKIEHCCDRGCLRQKLNILSGEKHELCRGLHAEQNAIIQAGLYGINIKNSILYCTHQPCIVCAKMIINVGIEKIIFEGNYPDNLSLEILKEANIELVLFKKQ
ncbi:MAG: cytidine/deoxycytidylate deaminase family protein [bacterium]